MRNSHANSGIDFPVGRQIQVDCRHNLLFLIPQRIEAGDRAEIAIILQTRIDFFRNVVARFKIRRELPTFGDIRTVKRAFKRRVNDRYSRPIFCR